MRTISFKVEGVTDLMFGKAVTEAKKDSETHAQHEARCWKDKCRVTGDGQLYLNPFAITNSLVDAAIWLGRKVPGEGKKTFTDRFRKGVAPTDQVKLWKTNGNGKLQALVMEDVDPVEIFAPSDGKHGGPKRVTRIFPTVHEWTATGSVLVFDGKISVDQFHDHLEAVGMFIGWGSMRVQGGGVNGRFSVVDISESEV